MFDVLAGQIWAVLSCRPRQANVAFEDRRICKTADDDAMEHRIDRLALLLGGECGQMGKAPLHHAKAWI